MNIEEIKKMKRGLTHAGIFHSDDVFSAAFLKIINPNIEIIRSFNVPDDFDGIVFDIGLGKFDHHQADNEVRTNGKPYASFGKLWREFAPQLYSEEVVRNVDKYLIENLDLSDNTGLDNALAYAISSFNPLWDSSSNGNVEFLEAEKFAKQILENVIENEVKKEELQEKLLDIYEKTDNKQIIVLDSFIPFKKVLVLSEAIFVIYPSKRGGYCVQGVPQTMDLPDLKVPFPRKWCDELPEGITFCHNSLFLICTKTLDDALKYAKELL